VYAISGDLDRADVATLRTSGVHLQAGAIDDLITRVFRSHSGFRPVRGGDGGAAPWQPATVARKVKRSSQAMKPKPRGEGTEIHASVSAGSGWAGAQAEDGFGVGVGDSGSAPTAIRANARRVLVCCAPEMHSQLHETTDPFDRAHAITALMGRHEVGVAPAARRVGRGRSSRIVENVQGARPRLYPQSQMTSRGVAFDSAYDGTHDIQEWLRREGLAPTEAKCDPVTQRAHAASLMGPLRFKVMTRQGTHF